MQFVSTIKFTIHGTGHEFWIDAICIDRARNIGYRQSFTDFTESLYNKLDKRVTDKSNFWVDSCCINQIYASERSI